MPPKEAAVAQPVPTDISGISQGLASDDNDRIVAALGALFTLEARQLPQDEASAADLVAQVLQQAASQNVDARNAAVKAAARLISISGPSQQLLLTNQLTIQHAWAVLTDMHIVWPSYVVAVQQVQDSGGFAKPESGSGGKKPAPAAAKGAAAPATASDPESSLPGPNKQTLDAALRIIAHLALHDPPALATWLITTDQGADESSVPPMGDLVVILDHHSPRVQYRAIQVLGVLASAGSLATHLVAAHAVAKLLALVGSSPAACIRLAACQALQVLFKEPGAARTAAETSGAVGTLVQLVTQLLTSGAIPHVNSTPAPPQGEAAPAAPALDFKAPAAAQPGDVLLSAFQLLESLTHYSQEATRQLVHQGGLQLLVSTLPVPREPFSWSGASPAQQPEGDAEPVPAPAEDTAQAEQASESAGQDEQVDKEQVGTDSSQDWLTYLMAPVRTDVPPLTSSEAQAAALQLLGNMLSIHGLQDALYAKLLSTALPPAIPPEAIPAEGTEPPVSAVEEAAAGSHGPGGPPDLLAYLLGFFSGAPPPPPQTLVESPTKAGKGEKPKPAAKGKEEAPAAPGVPAHLLPPFPATVKAAALHALVSLCRHVQLAHILGSHPEVLRLIGTLGAPQENAVPVLSAPPGTPGPGNTTPLPDTPQPASTPRATLDTPTIGEAATPEPGPTPDAGLAHAVTLLVQTLAATSCKAGVTVPPASEDQGSHQQVQADEASQHRQIELVKAAKALAAYALDSAPADYLIKSGVATAVLALPEAEFVAPPRPPLPSPPPTPPPLPLATTVFLWDALDRPMMADGSVKLEYQ